MKKKKNYFIHHRLQVSGVKYDKTNLNTLVKYPSEGLEHFEVKSSIFYILREMNHDVLCEFEIDGFGIGDLLDVSTTTPVQYEIETHVKDATNRDKYRVYARRGLEIIIVDTKKLPENSFERYEYLRENIVIPD